jgi:hypothetical protein
MAVLRANRDSVPEIMKDLATVDENTYWLEIVLTERDLEFCSAVASEQLWTERSIN